MGYSSLFVDKNCLLKKVSIKKIDQIMSDKGPVKHNDEL